MGAPPSLCRSCARQPQLRAALLVERQAGPLPPTVETAVPDVLAPGLEAVFCGINPGRASAAAGAAFANPRNDFWRLLHAAGFTPRLLAPHEQGELLRYGYGLTNAARRTTRGSSELRRADFAGSEERLQAIADELRPRAIAFVGKAAYEGTYRERPELGLQAAPPGRHAALRPAVHVAGERRRAVGGAAVLVQRSSRAAQPVHKFVIGIRRSRPNARGRSFTPGGA